ncbi:hypothetical protein MCAP1_001804 [Malassezia caprae]|uniref:Uncharacterized protein n=1 Tax=Malassezia caprae TaxID=1381934 RepID=A0AAF0J013_9BASI|nr:hypothetical protein MCAP1_001804 [Malassezia caprae]
MSWLRAWFGCCVCPRSKGSADAHADSVCYDSHMKNEQTPLLPPADGPPSGHLPSCRFPEEVINECLADLRTCVACTYSRKMLPVAKDDAPMQASSVVVETPVNATVQRSPGQILVHPMTPTDTSPASKIPPGADSANADEKDVVEATRARLLRCLAESEAS